MTTRADPQRDHWSRTYAMRPDVPGGDASGVGRATFARFKADGVRRHDAAIVGVVGEGR